MKHFILVAGYPKPPRSLPFRTYCENRVLQHVAANKTKEDLVFQILDVGSGENIVRTFTYPGGNRTETRSALRIHVRVTRAHYKDDVFKDGQEGVMSALDVYAAVQGIGIRAPGTLRELSFFSHGHAGGPVLVDSIDDGLHPGPGAPPGPERRLRGGDLRDPDDMDPRPKDFRAANMESAKHAAFRAAYHPDAINWSWGCASDDDVNEILYKLEHHPDYRSSGLPDDKILVFRTLSRANVADLEMMLNHKFADHRKVELTFNMLKLYIRRHLLGSYAHALAVASDRTTYSALIGTYAERDLAGPRPLMHVNPRFAAHFTFYRNYLGFTFDPERRWYGAFKPTFT